MTGRVVERQVGYSTQHSLSPILDRDPYIVEIYDTLEEWALERVTTFNHPLSF